MGHHSSVLDVYFHGDFLPTAKPSGKSRHALRTSKPVQASVIW